MIVNGYQMIWLYFILISIWTYYFIFDSFAILKFISIFLLNP